MTIAVLILNCFKPISALGIRKVTALHKKMVVKMMWWPPRPPVSSRKFEVKAAIQKLQGLNMVQFDTENDDVSKKRKVVVEIKWKGQKRIVLGPLRRPVQRNFTEQGVFLGDGVFQWNEEFKTVCNFSGNKEGLFLPWEVQFTVFGVSSVLFCSFYV